MRRAPIPTPGPEVDTPQALADWAADLQREQDREADRLPMAGEL